MSYQVEINHCKCHPETCGCNDWKVTDSEGTKISTHYHKEDAQRLANLLNAKESK